MQGFSSKNLKIFSSGEGHGTEIVENGIVSVDLTETEGSS